MDGMKGSDFPLVKRAHNISCGSAFIEKNPSNGQGLQSRINSRANAHIYYHGDFSIDNSLQFDGNLKTEIFISLHVTIHVVGVAPIFRNV